MIGTFIPKDQVEFKNVKYLKIHDEGPVDQHPYKFNLMLPEPLASWDVFDYWEKERTRSIKSNLKKGDVLFDIGAEHGWLSVIYAQFVGGENMVLFEPTPEFWPNIKATWEANHLAIPRANMWALVGSESAAPPSLAGNTVKSLGVKEWPDAANTGQLISKLAYRYLHDPGHVDQTPTISIDDFVDITGIVPGALTMDTEGAEILVLKGAEKTLREHKPLVWASLHPDLAIRDGYGDIQNVHDFMASLRYLSKHLATDHEEHWLYYPIGKEVV